MLQRLMNLCQSHGIAYPVESILNSTAYTCYNYGSRGARLRRNITNEWWKNCTRSHGNIHLVENAFLNSSTYQSNCQSEGASRPNNFSSTLSEGILQHYLPTLNQVRSQLPFGSAQIGKCMHPVVSDTDKFIYSSSEQTDLTLHFYVPPTEASQWMDKFRSTRLQWWTRFARTPSAFTVPSESENMTNDGCAKTINIEYTFPWGPDTLESIQNHGSKPFSDLQDQWGVSLEGLFSGRYVLPDLIEVHTTVERAMSAFLSDAYQQKDNHLKFLRLHPRLAPYYVALVTEGFEESGDLSELTRHLAAEMRGLGISVLDVSESTNPGFIDTSRYDETGVTWTVILSPKTLEGGIAFMRNRDTTIKERINIADLCKRLVYHLNTS